MRSAIKEARDAAQQDTKGSFRRLILTIRSIRPRKQGTLTLRFA